MDLGGVFIKGPLDYQDEPVIRKESFEGGRRRGAFSNFPKTRFILSFFLYLFWLASSVTAVAASQITYNINTARLT